MAARTETLLNGFVRFYQALDGAGAPVKRELYVGMVHNFQDRMPDAPESLTARTKIRAFLSRDLGLRQSPGHDQSLIRRRLRERRPNQQALSQR